VLAAESGDYICAPDQEILMSKLRHIAIAAEHPCHPWKGAAPLDQATEHADERSLENAQS
jgi:hypothetical protein